MNYIKSNIAFIVASLFYTIVTLLSLKLPFFWDNILFSSKTAMHFYNEGLASIILPPGIDSGHPPFWGKFISITWLIFGKSLVVSHLVMLPFLIALAYNFIEFVKQVLPTSLILPATILLLLEPTLLAHSTMVSLEIVLVCSFFGALNAILKNKTGQLSLWCLLMVLMSNRGIFLTIAVFACYCIYQLMYHKKLHLFKAIKPFLLPAVVTIIWFLYHWQATGYFLQSENSSWANNYSATNIKIVFKELIITFWRYIDFGRWIIFLPILPLYLFFKRQKKLVLSQNIKFTVYCLFVFSVILIAAVSINQNPPLHRYYIVAYLLISVIFLFLINIFNSKTIKKLVLCIVSISLITGHLWVYPDRVSQGWDGSLAHLPFFDVKKEMMYFMNKEIIDVNFVATDFPLINRFYYSDLVGNRNDFRPKHKVQLKTMQYVLQSNVCNGFSDETLTDLESNWKLKKEIKKRGVYIRLYENSFYN